MENRNPAVDQWLEQYANPQRELVNLEAKKTALRAVILAWIRDKG